MNFQTLGIQNNDLNNLRDLLGTTDKVVRRLERINRWVLIALAVLLAMAEVDVFKPWLAIVHFVHLEISVILELGLWGYITLVQIASRVVTLFEDGIESILRRELKGLSPFFSIVTKDNHGKLFTFSTTLLQTTGELINALGTGTVNYEDPAFNAFRDDSAKHYAEFVYYWMVETVLRLNAAQISSLTMAHYIPPTGFYPVFIKRFQEAQRRMRDGVVIKKLYRFRDPLDYDQKIFEAPHSALEWSRQVPFSQLMIEEDPRNTIFVAYGTNDVTSLYDGSVEETIVIKLDASGGTAGADPKGRTIVAVAAKDQTNFRFQWGRIYMDWR